MVRLAFLFTTTNLFFVVVLIWYLKREFLSQLFCMLFIGTYPRTAFRDEYLSIMLITKLFSLKTKICSYICWWKRMWVRMTSQPVKWTSSPGEIYWGNRTSFWVCLPMQAAREFEDYLDLCDSCLILVQKEGKTKCSGEDGGLVFIQSCSWTRCIPSKGKLQIYGYRTLKYCSQNTELIPNLNCKNMFI